MGKTRKNGRTIWGAPATALAAAGVLALSACGGSSTTGGGTAESEGASASGEGIKVGVVLAGPRNDRAFYQSYLDGVESMEKEAGLTISVIDNVEDPQAAVDAFTNLAADSDLIIAGGSSLVSAGNTVAPQFPDVDFVMSGDVTAGISNLHTYATKQGTPAYVAGVVAAQMSKSGTIGYVGGTDIPPNAQSLLDFEAGAKSEDPKVEVASTTVGSLSDAAKAKEATAAQIANGVDVVYAFQDAGLPGVLDAIKDSGKDVKAFNPTSDRCEESDQLVGYAYQNTAVMVEQIIADYEGDSLPAEPKYYRLDDPDVQALMLCDNSADYQAAVDETTAGLNDGSITLPENG